MIIVEGRREREEEKDGVEKRKKDQTQRDKNGELSESEADALSKKPRSTAPNGTFVFISIFSVHSS